MADLLQNTRPRPGKHRSANPAPETSGAPATAVRNIQQTLPGRPATHTNEPETHRPNDPTLIAPSPHPHDRLIRKDGSIPTEIKRYLPRRSDKPRAFTPVSRRKIPESLVSITPQISIKPQVRLSNQGLKFSNQD